MWLTETQIPEPKEIREVDETLDIESFIGEASQGVGFRWRGDYHRAKDFLIALNRRIENKTAKNVKQPAGKASRQDKPAQLNSLQNGSLKDTFHLHRQSQASRARLQSRLLLRVEHDLHIKIPRAPNISQAIREALGERLGTIPRDGFDLSLTEILGMIGAHEWRKKGILVPALGEKIYSHYGVFAPIRSEYLELVKVAALPTRCELAFDIGTGTGVIAAILAKRGIAHVTATDSEPRALICAKENILNLSLEHQVKFLQSHLFPEQIPRKLADLIVCNPPWIPARPTSRLETAVYDFESQMLRGFLAGAKSHLAEHGEVWLIISNLAELLGLRERDDLMNWISLAGLKVESSISTKPSHRKARDAEDPLFTARAQEVTTLWRLKKA